MAASMGRVIGKSSLAVIKDSGLLIKHQAAPLYNVIPVMYMRNKHYDPKFKKARMYKQAYFNKQQIYESRHKESPYSEGHEEMVDKEFRKNKDTARPTRNFAPRARTEFDASQIVDAYVPPEGDGKHSFWKQEGITEAARKIRKKFDASVRATRKIKKNGEETFSPKDLAPELLHIYIEAHNRLTNLKKNKSSLHDLVTSECFTKMTFNTQRMTIKWEFVENIEPPRSVHVACADGKITDVYYAQVTLRVHTKQILALYDQFGRLIFGDPHNPRDVLEFIVFEKNIVDLYGRWRMVDKIQPSWLPQYHKLPTFYKYDSKPETTETKPETTS